jgi:glycosyltransferase involved in cell wall biosynthesis
MAKSASHPRPRGDALSALLTDALGPCLAYPERLVPPNSWAGHIPFAFWLVGAMRPNVIVELGVHSGNSYAAFCQAVQSLSCGAACFGVDTWQGDDQAGFYGEEIYTDLVNWHDARYGGFSRLVRSTFDSAVAYFEPGSIDLLHIDGLHTYEAARHDFETWLPRLSSRSVVLFHDTNVRDRNFGVWRLWAELSAEFPNFEFIHGHGLGVLGVGSALPDAVATFFEAGREPDNARRIRAFFARLGDPLMRDVLLESARADLSRASTAEQTLRQRGLDLQAALEAARADAAAADQAFRQADQDLRQEAEAARATLAETRREAAKLADDLAAARSASEAREAEQTEARDAALADQARAEAELATLQRRAEDLDQRIRERDQQLRWSNDSASLQQAAIDQFERDLAQRRSSTFFKLFREIMRIERQARGVFKNRLASPAPRTDARRRSDSDDETEPGPRAAEPVAAPQFHPITLCVRPLQLFDNEPPSAEPPALSESRPLLICLSHILPWPTRAGNEYGSRRMLSWFMSQGWDVVLLYCPLPGEEPTPAQLAEACRVYHNLVMVGRDGVISHRLARPDVAKAVAALDGRRTRDIASLVGETADGPVSRLYLPIRTFCPDVLAEASLALNEALGPRMVLANYVFTTRGLPLLKSGAIRAVQSHDVFSTKAEKVVQFGVEDSLAMSASEEAHLLAPVDLVLAVQSDEAAALRKLAPHAKVLLVGIDMPVVEATADPPARRIVLMVASGNAMNTKGLRDFLRFAWPLVRRELPDAELRVVGSVGAALGGDEPGVRRLGFVEDLARAYADARVVINPAVAGTGLKIKTLEALANLRPIVLWPSGADGMTLELATLCERVTDWYEFADAVIRLLRDDGPQRRIFELRDRIAELLSPKTVFVELERAMGGIGEAVGGPLGVAAQ